MASFISFVIGMLLEFLKRAAMLFIRALHWLRYAFFISALAFLAFSFLYLLSAAPYMTAPKYSSFNYGWDGISSFYALASRYGTAKAAYASLDELSAFGKDATLIIVAPERAYTAKERLSLREFVSSGGTLIICDAGGYGADIAEEFRLKFSNATVVDYLSFNRRQDFPVVPFAVGGESGFAFMKFPAALLNYPPQALVLASTSPQSFIDLNTNLAIDEQDLKGPFAIAAAVDYGEGRVVAVSDSDAFSNDLISRADNVIFADALLSRYSTGFIIFDETHRFGERDVPLLYLFTYREKMLELSFVSLILLVVSGMLLAAHRLWVSRETAKVEAQRDLKLHTYRDLIWDITANAKLRAEPYTWIVLMQYGRFRDRLLRSVDPFRKELSNKELCRKAAKKSGMNESDLAGLLERLEAISNGESAVRSIGESTALCRIMDDYLQKLKQVK